MTDLQLIPSVQGVQLDITGNVGLRIYSNQELASLASPTVWKTGTKETAVQDRAIPIPELWSRFVRGENIADGRMYREPSFNPIEDNPYKRKGLDRADVPELLKETANMKQTAIAQAEAEIEAYQQSQIPKEPEKTVTPSE